MIKKIKEVVVNDNGFVKVFNDEVEFPDGSSGHYFKYELSERFPNFGISVVPVYKNEIIMFKNYRYALEKYALEVVKGMGMNDKTPEETAIIEIREEIGGVVKEIESLGYYQGDLSSTTVYCFMVEIDHFIETKHEASESIIDIKTYSIEFIKKMILEQKITDTGTLSILNKFLIHKGL